MSPTFVPDWSRLHEGARVNVYVKGADSSNWDDVAVSYVDDGGESIKVWSDVGWYPREPLLRNIYEVELLAPTAVRRWSSAVATCPHRRILS